MLCFCVCLSSSCVLCVRCCQYLWIVRSWLTLRFSLSLIHHILSLLSDKQWNGLSFLSIKDHDIKVICIGSDGIKSMTFYLHRKERDLDVKTVYNTTVKEGVRYDRVNCFCTTVVMLRCLKGGTKCSRYILLQWHELTFLNSNAQLGMCANILTSLKEGQKHGKFAIMRWPVILIHLLSH